ncbi:type VII secretion protein EccCa [Micromonospora sp. WMMA1363]|uniref:type VII secretion protein EccCa n=1 Tax=Micromonospora sp. WMMA1363 TaxID=3053985 RepID=UPI00259CAF51|nr:type VII secretion protein EccCa [Micromonospora sp. WMMA1363]MDM4721477.1 type VII secretion protein EccCa [Micromonospora sp. WMMA1363]
MSIVISRPPRGDGPPLPHGQIELQEPPTLPEPTAADMSTALTYLPMGLGSGATMLMFASPGVGPMGYLASGLMGVSTLGMVLVQLGRGAGQRKRELRSDRRDYLRYLAQIRRRVRRAANQQRVAVGWIHPPPSRLWSVAMGPRLWERRVGHDDFAEVRIGVGEQRAALRLVPPQTAPVEDLEPLCASALRRFMRAYQAVTEVPAVVHLPGFAGVELVGDEAGVLSLGRALLAHLAALHAPEELRIAVLADPARMADWTWAKWLPHTGHPTHCDGAGVARLFADDYHGLVGVLGERMLARPRFTSDASASSTEPFLVVVCDGVPLPDDSPLIAGGLRNTVLLDVGGANALDGPEVLQLGVEADQVTVRQHAHPDRRCRVDGLSVTRAEALARLLAPYRTGGGVDATEPMAADFDLTRLLGIGDPHSYDVHALWRSSGWGDLRVPIGMGPDGDVVTLDLRESAQGGNGPHGVLIGATGSGKSELLRTLVVALAATHSSESLNFVLTDFKGGATFLGMEKLPHTSAVITNLADELVLVDRMQDSLHGEMIRRQKLLRQAGVSSRLEYEVARAEGASLESMPTLLIVVDEFSELLGSKPEFMELFVTIGRLGRSLGVHLLLASQRLDEGRIHQLESHLSYRIALRTFSASESRSVIGSGAAYELPSSPGHGYVKLDTSTLVRFKAGYVSGPCATTGAPTAGGVVRREITAFDTGPVPVPVAVDGAAEPEAPTSRAAAPPMPSLMAVLIGRLRDQGPRAREVWLAPLGESPTMSQLLPGIGVEPARGMTAQGWPDRGRLRAPVGVVDRPFDQMRDLLVADLGGAAGHVGVVGAPQSGKSTMVRTLLIGLALTHTPAEVQFYCLDFGGGALAGIGGLPHVGSTTSRLDPDRVRRTVAEVEALLERREQLFADHDIESMASWRKARQDGTVEDPYGDVFLVVDGWFTLRQEFEDLEPKLSELASRGLGYGIHLIITAARWSEIRPWLRDLIGTRFELRLGDPLESEVRPRAAAGVPAQSGRGLTAEALHFLAAVPRTDGGAPDVDAATALRCLVEDIADAWPGQPAPPVRLLPASLPVTALPPPEGDLRLALGWDEQRLEPVWHDFARNPHLLVFGDGQTGKTNLLRLVAESIVRRYEPSEARIALADPQVALYQCTPEEYRVGYATDVEALTTLAGNTAVSMRRRLPGPDVTPDRLHRRDWWTGPRVFLLVDDYDLLAGGMPGPLDPLVELLAKGADIGLHLVVARSSSGGMRAMMDPALRRIWELACPGLLLSCAREEGKFLGDAAPRQLPPGRAQLVTRRGIQVVQTAEMPPTDLETT